MTEGRDDQVTVNTPGCYAVVVAGSIDAAWLDHFDGIRLESSAHGETRLIGYVSDQAALQGILERLYGLNLPILSVVRLKDDDRPADPEANF